MEREYFGPWLRKHLDRREWIAADLARKIPTSEGTVSHWLRGDRIPRPASCDRIADALGLSIEEVLRVAGHLPPDVSPDQPDRIRLHVVIDGIDDEDVGTVLRLLEPLYDRAAKRRASGD